MKMAVNTNYVHQEYPKVKYPADITKQPVTVNSPEEEKKLKGEYLDTPVEWKNADPSSMTAEKTLKQAVDITNKK